ncbi:MAG: hypothetical protein GY850_30375, partial [bacterium]|nr:hypothetical protein [bacterium]
GDALNKGLKLARGKYVLILQADDKLYVKNCLSNAQRLLQDEACDIYSFPVVKEYSSGERRPYWPIRVAWWYRFKTVFPHQGCFVHRRLYDSVGPFRTDLQMGVDYDFFYRAMQKKPRIKYGTSYIALMGGAGMSSRNDLLSLRLREEYLIQQQNEECFCWQIMQRCFRTLYVPYKTFLVPWIKHGCVKVRRASVSGHDEE